MINFFKYIFRKIETVPGDIEFRAIDWHLNHFGLSVMCCLFIGGGLYMLKNDVCMFICAMIFLEVVFICSELYQLGLFTKPEKNIKEFADSVTDMNQYQLGWVVVTFMYGIIEKNNNYFYLTILIFVVIMVIYVGTIRSAKP